MDGNEAGARVEAVGVGLVSAYRPTQVVEEIEIRAAPQSTESVMYENSSGSSPHEKVQERLCFHWAVCCLVRHDLDMLGPCFYLSILSCHSWILGTAVISGG